LKKLSFFSPGP